MLLPLIPNFEKNILADKEYRRRLIQDEKEVIRDYLNAKIEQVGFEEALDSECVQYLWNDLTASLNEHGVINHRFISGNYYFRGLSERDNSDKSGSTLFTLAEFKYLAYNLKDSINNSKELKEKMLPPPYNFINIPVSPMVLRTMDEDRELEYRLSVWMDFNIPVGMEICDYYEKNLGLINNLPASKINKGLTDYMHKSKDFIYEMYGLFVEYLNEPMGSQYESVKWNETKIDKIFKEYLKIIFSIGLDEMLKLPTTTFSKELDEDENEGLEQLFYYLTNPFDKKPFELIIKEIKDDIVISDEGETITYKDLYHRFIVDSNKMDALFEKEYSQSNNNESMIVLFEALEKGKIDKIYITNDCFIDSWTTEIHQKVMKNKDRLILGNGVSLERWNSKLNEAMVELKVGAKFDDLQKLSSPKVYYGLVSIFNKLFDWYDLSEDNDSHQVKKEKQLKLMSLIDENQNKWFEINRESVRINREMKEIAKLKAFTKVGLDELMKLSEEFKR